MNLKIKEWKPFKVQDIFDIFNGKGITKEEIENNPGDFIAIQSGSENNGCIGKIDKDYCIQMGYTYSEDQCLTLARTGTAGFVTYQPYGCVVGDSAKILVLKDVDYRKKNVYLFLRTILMALKYKYDFGRKVTEDKYYTETIQLPVTENDSPDYRFMESYIASLHNHMITTRISNPSPIEISNSICEWQDFYLHKILKAEMGNGIDAITTTSDNPKFNYIGRSASNNGIVGFIDEIDEEEPYPQGAITLSLGGSLGACFIQPKPFYTAQNVAVLQEKTPLSIETKLFLISIIKKECKIKFQPFGRELNAHFRKDFILKLPIKHNENGIIYDERHEYSEKGYIPDWQWMENYIKSLPYSDRI